MKQILVRLTVGVALCWCLCASAPSTHADIIQFQSTIDAGQEVPSGTSTGTGFATVTFDDVANVLSWNIQFSGLTGAATAMHFHQAPAGSNGGVVVNIGTISGLGSPSIGSTSLTNAGQIDALLNDGFYINIHTAANPGGEIRGQVIRAIPEPTSALVLSGLMGVAACAYRRRR